MTRAAKELHIAQPSFSRAIHSMEEELGVPLFEHEGRNIRLTAYGRIVFDYASIILSDLEEMKSALHHAQAVRQHTVRLSYYTASLLIISFLMQFHKERPDIRVDVIQHHTHDAAGAPGNEPTAADLVLSTSAIPVEDEATVTLLREPLVLALRADDPHARLPYANMEDFCHANFISLPTGFAVRDIITQYCQEHGFTPHTIAYSDNPAAVADFIRAGLGVSVVPQYCWHMLRSEEIVFLPISERGFHRYITLHNTQITPPPVRNLRSGPVRLFCPSLCGIYPDPCGRDAPLTDSPHET